MSVGIVGAGWSLISRRADSCLAELVLSACGAALTDAGLEWSDVDGLATYPSTAGAGGSVEGIDTVGVEYIAQTLPTHQLSWYASLERGTIGHVLAAAVNAVEAGTSRIALVWKGMHSPSGSYGEFQIDEAPGESQFRAPFGMGGPYNAGGGAVAEFAMPYSQYLTRYGRDRLEMGPYAIHNRGNAASNPHAIFFRKPLSEDDWTASRLVSDPLSVLDCDMAVDGAGAVVVVAGDIARRLSARPAWVVGHSNVGIHRRRAPTMLWDDLAENASHLVDLALARSGVGMSDIRAAALYDGFSYFVPMWLEATNVCGPGEAFDFIADAQTTVGNRLAVNVFGGNLGMGRLHGMPQIIEAIRQVQGSAWDGQPAAEPFCLATVGSATHGAATFVLSNEARSSRIG